MVSVQKCEIQAIPAHYGLFSTGSFALELPVGRAKPVTEQHYT